MARALAWHARGHRFDPDILHFQVQIFDMLTQARHKREKTFSVRPFRFVPPPRPVPFPGRCVAWWPLPACGRS